MYLKETGILLDRGIVEQDRRITGLQRSAGQITKTSAVLRIQLNMLMSNNIKNFDAVQMMRLIQALYFSDPFVRVGFE